MAIEEKSVGPSQIEFYGGYEVYSDSGVDLTQLRRNLTLGLEDRFAETARSAGWLAALSPKRIGPQVKPNMFDPGRLIQHLIQQQVEFVVIGGLAMIAQGSSYVTKDLDICYRRTLENLAKIETAFATLQLCPLPDEVTGVGVYEQALIQSEEKSAFRVTFRVLTLDGLIAAKKAAGRNKDQMHLFELAELKKLRDSAQDPNHGRN